MDRQTLLNSVSRRTKEHECWQKWLGMCGCLRGPHIHHISIQTSRFAAFVWPRADVIFHSQQRTVASFKEIFCWLSVSSKENEGCCPAEGKDYVFMRPTQAFHHQHHSVGWKRPKLEGSPLSRFFISFCLEKQFKMAEALNRIKVSFCAIGFHPLHSLP